MFGQGSPFPIDCMHVGLTTVQHYGAALWKSTWRSQGPNQLPDWSWLAPKPSSDFLVQIYISGEIFIKHPINIFYVKMQTDFSLSQNDKNTFRKVLDPDPDLDDFQYPNIHPW